jgi:prephenate dehydratase
MPIALAQLSGIDARELYALARDEYAPRIATHGMDIGQCHRFIRAFYPRAERISAPSGARLATYLKRANGRRVLVSVRNASAYHAIAVESDGTLSDNGSVRERSVWSRHAVLWAYVIE